MSTYQHAVDIVVNEQHPSGVVYHAGSADIFPNITKINVQLHPDGIPTADLQLSEFGLDLKEVSARAGVVIAGQDYVLIDPDSIVYSDVPSDEILVMRGQAKPAAAALTAKLVERELIPKDKAQLAHQVIQEFYRGVLAR